MLRFTVFLLALTFFSPAVHAEGGTGDCNPTASSCSEGDCAGKTITAKKIPIGATTSQVSLFVKEGGSGHGTIQWFANSESGSVTVGYDGCSAFMQPCTGNWGGVRQCSDICIGCRN